MRSETAEQEAARARERLGCDETAVGVRPAPSDHRQSHGARGRPPCQASRLWAIVFGMDPGTPWRGPDIVDGYLIATKDEEVLAYQVSRQKDFEDYLLRHSSFDTPSTKRNERVGVVRQENGKWYYSLQCVVKFQPNSWSGDKAFFDR